VQNLILQGQLAAVSNNVHDTSNNISQEQDGNTRMDEEGLNVIQGGEDQGSGSEHSEELPESQTDDWDWCRGCAPGWESGEGRVAAQGAI
jgi:hypothetical protein